jgi:hypothetical protein
LDIDTCGYEFEAFFHLNMLRMPLIVAVTMDQHFVTQVVVIVVAINVIHLHNVSIFEVQFTPTAFSLLLLEQSRFRLMHHWMSFQTLAPIGGDNIFSCHFSR